MGIDIKMNGLIVGGIFPLENPYVATFMQGQVGKNYTDHEAIEDFLKKQERVAYRHIMPEDTQKMWMHPNDESLLKGRRGYAEVYADPSKMRNGIPDPDHCVVFYFAVEEVNSTTLKKELVLAYVGSAAHILMVHRNSCCSEYSVTVDGKLRGQKVEGSIDSLDGTQEACRGVFIGEDGKTLLTRVPTVEEAKLIITRDPSMADLIKAIRMDVSHAITHAIGDERHQCSSFKVQGPAPA